MKRILPVLVILFTLSACGRLDSIPYTPAQTPETWLQIQPVAEFQLGSLEIIFVQPSTSIIVYLLGFITIAAGAYFLKTYPHENNRLRLSPS